MILDSSALIAILRNESEATALARRIAEADVRRLSAANYLETAIVMDACKDPVISRRFDELLQTASVRVEAVTEEQARIARQAYRDYGKGSGHPAQLNFGDCFAYALAKDYREALLFKGDDFCHTDLTPAG